MCECVTITGCNDSDLTGVVRQLNQNHHILVDGSHNKERRSEAGILPPEHHFLPQLCLQIRHRAQSAAVLNTHAATAPTRHISDPHFPRRMGDI